MPQKRGDIYESARRLGHKPIVESDLVQEELQGFETRESDPDQIPLDDYSVALDDLEEFGTDPDSVDHIISISTASHSR